MALNDLNSTTENQKDSIVNENLEEDISQVNKESEEIIHHHDVVSSSKDEQNKTADQLKVQLNTVESSKKTPEQELGDKIFQKENGDSKEFISGEKEFWQNEEKIFENFNKFCIDAFKKVDPKETAISFPIATLDSAVENIFKESDFLYVDGKFDPQRANKWFNKMFPYEKRELQMKDKLFSSWKWAYPVEIEFGHMATYGKEENKIYKIWAHKRISPKDSKPSLLRSLIGK